MTTAPEGKTQNTVHSLPGIEMLESFAPDADNLRANNIVGFHSRRIEARPFNLLRTQVSKRCAQTGWKILGVTSAEPGAGKSFISLNLAAALAVVEKRRVYLFDLDFCRASLARELGLEIEVGLADYLAGATDDLARVGRRIEGLNLIVFPTNTWTQNTASLFSGERFASLVQMMRRVPDGALVICDLPPVFANDDAMIIAQSLDAYLAVVNSGETNRKQLVEAFAMLEPTPRIGTVLNRYDGGLSDPYGYGSYAGNYAKYY